MNGEDIKWLEKLFDQHKAEQQLYLDTRFNNLEAQIKEIKELSSTALMSIGNAEKECAQHRADCIACINTKITGTEERIKKSILKKIVAGGVITGVATISLWAAFGKDIIKIIVAIFAGVDIF